MIYYLTVVVSLRWREAWHLWPSVRSASVPQARRATHLAPPTANLRTSTKILDFRGFDSSRIFSLKGWTSHVHREFPGKFEPTNRSIDTLREIGRSATYMSQGRGALGCCRTGGEGARGSSCGISSPSRPRAVFLAC